VVPAHAALNNLIAFFGDIDIRKINEKTLAEYQVARLTGTITKAVSSNLIHDAAETQGPIKTREV
jgi:hypothetical protein